jgi:tyrosyl-tRNA synthetase
VAKYEVNWVPITDVPGDLEYLVECCKAERLWPLIDIVATLMECSKSEARRLIEGKAVTIDDAILNEVDIYIDINSEEQHIKIGKRNHFRIKLEE